MNGRTSLTIDDDGTDQLVLLEHRHARTCGAAKSTRDARIAVDVGLVNRKIDDVDRLSLYDAPSPRLEFGAG